MALPATGVIEVQTGGSDTNAGMFDPAVAGAGTDYTQQAAAQFAYTDLVIGGTNTTLTSSARPFSSVDVGNTLRVTGGTGFTVQLLNIRSVAGAVATVDKAAGTASSTGGTANYGGALASPGQASLDKVAGMDVWIKAGTYTITSTNLNVSGGVVSDNGGASVNNNSKWEGYGTTRGDKGTRPLLQFSASLTASAISMFANSVGYIHVDNINFDANTGNTSATGLALSGNYAKVFRVKASNFTVIGISLTGASGLSVTVLCEATGCSGTAAINLASGNKAFFTESHGNTCHGFQIASGAQATWCISDNNSGASSDGFFGNAASYFADHCTAYNNGRAGFDITGNAALATIIANSISYGNGSEGFRTNAVADGSRLINCAGGNNTSGNYNTTNLVARNVDGFITLTASPFNNAGSRDFSLNTTAGGGAAARDAGLPAAYPSGATTSNADVGCAQHPDPTGGGTTTVTQYPLIANTYSLIG